MVRREFYFIVATTPHREREIAAFRSTYVSGSGRGRGRFVHISFRQSLIARRRHEDMPRSHDLVEHLVVKHVVAPEVLVRPLTKRHHTGFSHLVGIIEDILEPQRIRGVSIFIDVVRTDKLQVVAHGISHEADIALVGHPPIGSAEAASGCRARRVRAVRADDAVAHAPQCPYLIGGGVFSSHGQRRTDGVGRDHIPQPLDPVPGAGSVVESGVCQVEAYVLHPHDHPLARISLWQHEAFIYGCGVEHHGRRVHVSLMQPVGLDAPHATVARHLRQFCEGYLCDADVVYLCEHTHLIRSEHAVAVALHADEGGEQRRGPHPTLA